MATLAVSRAILIVAPPTLLRLGLVATLRNAQPDFPIDTTTDLTYLLRCLRQAPPALLILDASQAAWAIPELVEQFRAQYPRQRILVLGARRLPFQLSSLIVEMGGGMLLASRATPADLVAAVERLLGDVVAPNLSAAVPACAKRHLPKGGVSVLTEREMEVLHLMAKDHSSQQIAERLHISLRTVDSHRRVLLEKMGVRTAVGALLKAVRNGWLQLT